MISFPAICRAKISHFWFFCTKNKAQRIKDEKGILFMNFKIVHAETLKMESKKKKTTKYGISID